MTGYGLSTLGLDNMSTFAWWIQTDIRSLRMNIQHASGPAETLIPAAEVHSSDAVLTQHRSAHDAWLNRDIEIRFFEDLDGMLR